MKDYDGRKRQFVIRDKKEESFDAPSVRRRPFAQEEREETPEAPRPPRQRKTLREREMEEEEESRSFRRGKAERTEARPEEEFEEEAEERGRKAPKVVRVFAWIALMLILFACGYLATNYFFAWSDKKGGDRIGNVYGSSTEVKRSETSGELAASADSAAAGKYTLYLPDGDSLKSRTVEIAGGGTQEQDMMKLLSMYVDSLKETKMLDPATGITSLYQSGDWLYLDMTQAFLTSLKTLGKAKSEQVLSGFVKTVKENFSPLRRVKFYAGSREVQDKAIPVNLSEPWEGTK